LKQLHRKSLKTPMRKIIGLLLLMLPLSIMAQQTQIKVADRDTKAALPYVNVEFRSLKSGKKFYGITGKDGLLQNPCSDSCLVSISFMGYKKLQDTLAPGSNRTFFLAPDVFDLEQVVVTATRSDKALKDVPVITQVIQSGDIEKRGLTNVADVLSQEVSGIEFQRGGFGADIKLQGLDAKNVLILVDGERLAGENGNNIDYSRLNAANVERIEVVKGAASALYGSQAMGGVINIITKKPKQKWEASAGGKWSEMNERNYPDLQPTDDKYDVKRNLDRKNYNVNASFGFRLKHLNGRTDFATKSFDGYLLKDKKPISKEFINIDTVIHDALNPFPTGINGYRDYSIMQKIGIPINKKIDLELRGSYYNHDEYDFVPNHVHQNFEDYSYGGKLNYRISDKYALTASYNYDNYRKFDYYEKLDEKEMNYRNIFINPRLLGSALFGKNQEWTGGLEYLSESLLTDKFAANSKEEKSTETTIVFLQNDINVGKNWNFIAGARMDYHSAFGLHISPKLSGMYKRTHWTFRANYANGFRSPTLKELYMDWPIAWFTLRGDENLEPETNNYISGSVEFTKKFINTSVTAYYNKLKNKIDGVWENGQTIYQYVNVSEATLSGLEFMVKMHLFKHFMLSGAYNYLNDQRPQGELVSSASPHSGNAALNYRLLRKKYELNINLNVNIIGAKDYQVSEMINYRGQLVEGIYPVHFDAYAIWRLAVSQRFFNGVNITLGINNIFDYTANVVSFNTSISPGRRGYISMNINMDKLIKKRER
jgi:outer membrane receptor for ferrienterochelin and colicins